MARLRRFGASFLVVTSALALIGAPASADDDDRLTSKQLTKAVTIDGIREHQAAFQAHADDNGGTRAGGSPGYEASANYIVERLEAVGYEVTSQWFDFVYNADNTPPTFSEVGGETFVDGEDFASMTYSPNGDVTADVVAVDLVLPPAAAANTSSSGCEASDFAGFPAGAIALVQRGQCSFELKGQNAAAAGAVATIVFNEGQPGRTAYISGTLSNVQTHSAPVIGASFDVGNALANGVTNGDTGSDARVRVDRVNETRPTRNVIAR